MKRSLCLHLSLLTTLLGGPALGQDSETASPVRVLVAVTDSTRSPAAAGMGFASDLTVSLQDLPGVWPVSRLELESALDRFDLRESRLSVIEWRQLAARLNAEGLLLVVFKGGRGDAGNVLTVDMLDVRSGRRHPLLARRVGELLATSLAEAVGLELAGMEQVGDWPYEPLARLVNKEEVSEAVERFYPTHLREAGIGGTVGIWVLVEPAGQTRTAFVRTSSGDPELDDAAIEVARVMRFERARNRIALSPVWWSQTVVFEAR